LNWRPPSAASPLREDCHHIRVRGAFADADTIAAINGAVIARRPGHPEILRLVQVFGDHRKTRELERFMRF
jgi:hypothetical protein